MCKRRFVNPAYTISLTEDSGRLRAAVIKFRYNGSATGADDLHVVGSRRKAAADEGSIIGHRAAHAGSLHRHGDVTSGIIVVNQQLGRQRFKHDGQIKVFYAIY